MPKSIEIDHDMNDNNQTLLRDNDDYDIISTANNMKISSYLIDRYISAVMIFMILIRLIFINFITIDKNTFNYYQNYGNSDESMTKAWQVSINDSINYGVLCWYSCISLIMIDMYAVYFMGVTIGHLCILYCTNYYFIQLHDCQFHTCID